MCVSEANNTWKDEKDWKLINLGNVILSQENENVSLENVNVCLENVNKGK